MFRDIAQELSTLPCIAKFMPTSPCSLVLSQFLAVRPNMQREKNLFMKPIFQAQPLRLTHQCLDSVFELVSIVTAKHGLEASIDQISPLLSELPRELQSLLLKTAEKSLDFTYSVVNLLVIWLSCVDNGCSAEISTPKYLYNLEEGRKWILKKLGQYQNVKVTRQLSLQMYGFYSHLCTRVNKKACQYLVAGTFSLTILLFNQIQLHSKNIAT